MFLFFVRHGEPDYSNDCLTEAGRQQAKAVADRFALSGLEKIYSSTLGRALETAGYTAEKLGLNIERLDFAREDLAGAEFGITRNGVWNWCFWDRETVDLFKSYKVKTLGDQWYDSPLFAGTNYKNGIIRVQNATVEFMKQLGYSYNEKTGYYKAEKHIYDRVALFAHGGFSMAFLSCLLNIPYPEFCVRFQIIGVSAVTVLKIDDEGDTIIPQIYQYGNDSHLYKDNLLEDFDLRVF